jgi:CheY-like chemotaxis protein
MAKYNVDTGVSPDIRAPHALRTYIKDMPTKRILFIDDEHLLREVMYELLMHMGYEAKVVESGGEAIETFAENPENYDLVLTDLMMPDMTGDRIAKEIKSIRPNVPVVVMTATPETLSLSRVKTAGISRVLAKPLTVAELREGLQGII